MATEEIRVDANDPLYIHPSDHPGLLLVTSAFNGQNFGEWRRSLRVVLSAKNKLGLVTGKVAKPNEDSPRLCSWERCNDMVISWITNVLSPEIKRSVIYTTTAKGIWEALEARYGQLGGTQLYSVRKEIAAIEQGTKSFPEFFTVIKSLWDELDSLRKDPVCTCDGLKELLKERENDRILDLESED